VVAVIDAPALADQREQPRLMLEQMKCSRCGGNLARVALVVGSVVEMRCHHSVRRPDGKRETCGYVTRAYPTR
jgi:hypothetical protein